MHTLLLSLLIGCSCSEPPPPPPAPEPKAEYAPVAPADLTQFLGQPVRVEGRGLRLVEAGIELDVPYLSARLEPHGDVVRIDDPTTFDVVVEGGHLRLDAQSLSAAIPSDTPIGALQLSTEGDAFILEGKATFLSVPFKLRAVPEATADGRLELVLDKAKVLGIGIIPALKLIDDALGGHPSILVVDGDHLYLDPFATAKAPNVKATFTHAQIVGDTLVATLGEVPDSDDDDASSLTIAGGALLSGSTLLFDTTIVLHPDGQSHLMLTRDFKRQLRAGYTKMGENRRLDLFVPARSDDGVTAAD